MEVFLIFPKSKQAQQELGQELAKFQSEQALKSIQKLPCSTEQKLELVDAAVNGYVCLKYFSHVDLKICTLPCSHRLNFCSGTPSCVAYAFCVKPSRCRMALICAP